VRKNIINIGLVCVVILLSLIGCDNDIGQEQPSVIEGQSFPDLKLRSLDGQIVALSDFRGKLLVVNIWATWCGPCRRELPSLESLDKLLDDEKFAVLGVSIDEDALLVREYLSDKGITLPVYFNEEGVLDYSALGINVFPYTFIISPDGRLLDRFAGEEVWNSAEVVHDLKERLTP